MKLQHEQIQYIEFLSNDFTRIKKFYSDAFEWNFTDFGLEYTAFEGDFIDGGFAVGEPQQGSILVVLYSNNLEGTQKKVTSAGGSITKEIFNFPGGRRFEFRDLDGNKLAVWSNK